MWADRLALSVPELEGRFIRRMDFIRQGVALQTRERQ
jgi:hypothetical protein